MKCPECGFENPAGMNFCGKCGHKLEKVCPSCSFGNPPDFEFCGGCGETLDQPKETLPKDLSFDEKLSKIQRYLPKGLTEKILAQRDRTEGERKHVTVMFCDMVGFTPLVEKLGPEDAYALMDRVQEILIHKVHEYEGTVNQLTGDGLMALFGAPIALEDAPQRAIRSSLAIHREMTRFSEKNREESGFPTIKMRIGINTGPVVVGTVGNDLRVEFTAVGDTVNTASRMEGLAEPGTTCVTEETFKLTEGFFRFEGLGFRDIKGKEEPVRVYRVIAPSTRRTRFDVSAERGLTRFVGRERELEIMLDAFGRAKGGRGQAVSIVGEAGVGKSRLLYEFRKAVSNENATFFEGKCLSYSRGAAYHPIIDVLKSNFGIHEDDKDEEVREKVKRGLQLIEAQESSILPYLLEILSVKDSGIEKIPMSPEARKERIIEAVKRIVLKGSAMRPLILAIEDLHWMDKSSEDLSKRLLEGIPGARVLLISTYRPEFVHTWGGKSFHSQITLNRLSNRESLSMLAHMLGSEDIDCDLKDLILETSEGIPFFVEEFVRSLQDLKIITKTYNRYHLAKEVQELIIPSTIHDVIMARMDRLPEGAREVLQVGAAIEREFSHELIQEVTGLPERELLSWLSALKDAELLYERGVYPKSTYVFNHALTREVVYDSILTNRRKELHSQIGNAIEDLAGKNIDDYYGILVEHYLLSSHNEKAAHYANLAGKKAAKTGSIPDAIGYARKRIASLERCPQTEDVHRNIIDARIRLGVYCLQMNLHVQSMKAVDPVLSLATKYGLQRQLSLICCIVGAYALFVEENPTKAIENLEHAVRISSELNDHVSKSFANNWMGAALAFHCNFEKARQHFETSLGVAAATNNRWVMSTMKSQMNFWVHGFSGNVNGQLETAQEALELAEESGDTLARAMAYTCQGISCYSLGDFEKARAWLSESYKLSERIGNSGWNSLSQNWLAQVCMGMGEHLHAIDYFDNAALLAMQDVVCPSWVNLSKMGSVLGQVFSDDKNVDLEQLCRYCTDNKARIYEGWIRRYLGEILLNIDDQHTSDAQHWIEEAIEADRGNGMRFHLARDYALYAELFKRKEDHVRAKASLIKAIEIYKECGADGWVTKAEEELEKLQ